MDGTPAEAGRETSAVPAAERYSAHDVPVAGGVVRVGCWDPVSAAADGPVVVGLHGVTSSHLAFGLLPGELPGARVLAPDLRGRGHSAHLPGPYGFRAHAADVAAALRALADRPVLLVGHSMGAYVALTVADLYPDLVAAAVLVDGGPVLPLPEGVDPDQAIRATLGPSVDRLTRTFTSLAEHRELWQQHPAFGGEWDAMLAAYADYDLAGTAPRLRSRTNYDAVWHDSADLLTGSAVPAALARHRHAGELLLAERGMQDEPTPLYPDEALAHWPAGDPQVPVHRVPGVNHLTIVMRQHGAATVADAVGRLT